MLVVKINYMLDTVQAPFFIGRNESFLPMMPLNRRSYPYFLEEATMIQKGKVTGRPGNSVELRLKPR